MFDLTVSCSIFLFFVGLHLGICRREKKDFLLIKKFLCMSALGLLIFWCTSFFFHQVFTSPTSVIASDRRERSNLFHSEEIASSSLKNVLPRNDTTGHPPIYRNFLWSLALPFTATMFYILLTLIYLSFYVNVKLVSPSKKIMTLIREHKGMKYPELLKHFTDPSFIAPRLDDLVKSGCTRIIENKYRLSSSGRRIGIILEIYQKILGRPKGG